MSIEKSKKGIKSLVRKTGLKSEKQDKIMEVVYENPEKNFTIREIEKLTGIPRTTISDYLKEMKKRKFLNRDSLLFKTRKINYFIERIIESGVIEEIIKRLNPSCIILFGSVRKGDSVKESDIDLFIESPVKKELNLEKFEKILKHKIQLFVESNIKKLPKNLMNNVVNGIKLYGIFKIR